MATIYASAEMVNADASEKVSVDAILGRIMAVLGVKNDRQLSIKSGVSPTTISTWRKKDRIPYEFATRIAQENFITLDYILLGRSSDDQKNQNDRFGLVNAFYFRACYEAAEIIVKREPGLYALDTAFIIYNSMYFMFKMFEGGQINREEIIRSLSHFDFGVGDRASSVAEYIVKKLDGRIDAIHAARLAEAS